MRTILSNKWFKFIIVGGLYLLWVIWLGNYFWLIGLAVIFDIYITQKVHWSFWKKKNPPNGKQTKLVEWIDAIIFAVIAASFIRMFFIEAYTIPTSSMEKSMLVGDYLFVSKTAYGPKTPNTPLSFPFVHNRMPIIGCNSYSEAIKRPYKRLKGFGKIKNNDVVVFHFPNGDTIVSNYPTADYYQIVSEVGREQVKNNKRRYGKIISRPVDKCENYIKRCIGIPGDEIKIVKGQVYVNGEAQKHYDGVQYKYLVETDGAAINPKTLDKMHISKADRGISSNQRYIFPLTDENAEKMGDFANVKLVTKLLEDSEEWEKGIFPSDSRFPWNVDNYGPITIPKKGETIELNVDNMPLYKRLIDVYEENDLEVNGDVIKINGEIANSYTFKMDYYWMMGDNRHNSADSRYWGFVPEDHVVGKAVFIWLSLDKDKKFLSKIRFNRLFRTVK